MPGGIECWESQELARGIEDKRTNRKWHSGKHRPGVWGTKPVPPRQLDFGKPVHKPVLRKREDVNGQEELF